MPRVAYSIVHGVILSLPTLLVSDGWTCVASIHGDASSRRYLRLSHHGGGTAVVALYPASETARLGHDAAVSAWLRDHGVAVPRTRQISYDEGWVLLEDLGQVDAADSLTRLPEGERFEAATTLVEPLECLARIPPSEALRFNPPLGRARLRWELAGFELWFVRHHLGRTPLPALTSWLDGLATEVASHPVRVCHRDYHLNNLFLLDEGPVRVIDVQDALVGPDTYDAVSLLEERSMPGLLGVADRKAWIEEFAHRTQLEGDWPSRYRQVRAQRGLKVLGTFARLVATGREEYRSWLDDLGRRLGDAGPELGLTQALTDLLLHSRGCGGSHVR